MYNSIFSQVSFIFDLQISYLESLTTCFDLAYISNVGYEGQTVIQYPDIMAV